MDRKKLKLRFALLYIASLVLLTLIFVAFWNMHTTPEKTFAGKSTEDSTETSEAYSILQQDELLHKGLIELQQLDAKYALLFANSADKKSLDSLHELISKAENSFADTIQQVQEERNRYSSLTTKNFLDSITNSFRVALNNRRSNSFMRTAIAGLNNNSGTDQKELLKLKMDLSDKNDQILTLENTVKNVKNDAPDNSSSGALQTARQQVESLQGDIAKTKQNVVNLTTQNNNLSKENSVLTAQVNEIKLNTQGQKKVPDNDNTDLLKRIDELNAKLAFAQVDCNLTRADPRLIISNSKQRKDLLQEALNSLNNLAHSNNPSLQKKAKEKLVQLQSIASAAHD